ncbi:DUF6943 family protein [Polaribacter dokdonensis]|uniref:Uncharacterized protein n=1 Tax=Polaribacter dokdonensis DSW-5 TaxID=1300348 RepID=A0A1H5JYC9_9FLAO|nr:hypothetical protein [Polaribacter dokdonensis]SEE56931.1 hypothetical protein SAMN05444353_2418 [Polaribacter dokdonensis DSW-5]|tara:strand:- start:7284 stop:7703 length:420 start_codon:yes stop_codon:yes gene_type:complete
MSTFQIKTHQPGRIYHKPHFFILNKGLNSGKPFTAPVRNSFVVSTESVEQKEALFHLSYMLLEAKCYRFYLKGSVIPFIYIADVKNLLIKNSKYFGQKDFETKLKALKKVEELEVVFQNKLKAIQELKSVLLRYCKLEH